MACRDAAAALRVMERGRRGALGIGDRVLARTEEKGAGLDRPSDEEARALGRAGARRGPAGRRALLAVPGRQAASGASCPISDLKDAEAGDLVLCEVTGRPPRVSARVDAVLGDPFAPRSFSLIAIHKHGLRHEFAQEAIDEAHRVAQAAARRTRGPDALCRSSPSTPPTRATMTMRSGRKRDGEGGWNAIVAIADVSFYVRPGSELDREARARGNSVYFPDRVVPMLPEELSADICSLKEGEDRAALACHLKIGEGRRAQELALHPRQGPHRGEHRVRGRAGGDRCARTRSGSRSARRPAPCRRSRAACRRRWSKSR